MSEIKIFNENCFDTIENFKKDNVKVDIILTSPPYNTGRPSNTDRSRENYEGKYDVHIDNMTQQEYCDWCVKLFNEFDNVLSTNGVILWNVSYGSDCSVNKEGIGLVWLTIADIIRNTNFVTADRIIWKKEPHYQIMQVKIN